MTFYAVESKRQGMRSTGIVNEVFEWTERDGKRKPSETQARDEDTGMPLWQPKDKVVLCLAYYYDQISGRNPIRKRVENQVVSLVEKV